MDEGLGPSKSAQLVRDRPTAAGQLLEGDEWRSWLVRMLAVEQRFAEVASEGGWVELGQVACMRAHLEALERDETHYAQMPDIRFPVQLFLGRSQSRRKSPNDSPAQPSILSLFAASWERVARLIAELE